MAAIRKTGKLDQGQDSAHNDTDQAQRRGAPSGIVVERLVALDPRAT